MGELGSNPELDWDRDAIDDVRQTCVGRPLRPIWTFDQDDGSGVQLLPSFEARAGQSTVGGSKTAAPAR